MSRNTVARLNKLEAGRLPNPDSLFLLWVKPGTSSKEQTAQIHALGLSASLDGVICAEWISKEEMPPPRWRLYRDIPRNEIDVLDNIIKKTVLVAGADELNEAAAQPEASDFDRLSDRDLMARIFSVVAQ
jgi:hypothetical protein